MGQIVYSSAKNCFILSLGVEGRVLNSAPPRSISVQVVSEP
jgi:hypothetical protein